MVGPALGLTVTRYVPGECHAAHEHGELHLSVVLAGRLRERVGNRMEDAAPLSVVAKDPAVVHADEFGTDGALLARLSIPDCGIADLSDGGSASPWSWSHEPGAAAPFLRLVARAVRGQQDFAPDDGDIADLVAIVTRGRRHPRHTGSPPVWLTDAVEGIRDGWSPSLTVREVARASAVHPVYLARCVRRWFGVSASDLLRRARLARVASRLAADGGTVSTIAHEAGFADESHLCRSMAGTVGVTPGRLRRLVRAAAALDSRRRPAPAG